MAALALVLGACGASLPARFVLEQDVGPYAFRRYQRVLDVEVPVEGNAAEGHTAVYVRRGDGAVLAYATAFVTRYASARDVARALSRYVSSLDTYEVRFVEREGATMYLARRADDLALLWSSGRFIVKLGSGFETETEAPAETATQDDAAHAEPPPELVEAYLAQYPSHVTAEPR